MIVPRALVAGRAACTFGRVRSSNLRDVLAQLTDGWMALAMPLCGLVPPKRTVDAVDLVICRVRSRLALRDGKARRNVGATVIHAFAGRERDSYSATI